MIEKTKAITIREVAEAAGVSVASVSYVLNGTKKLSKETIARIRKAAENLGYVPDNLAKSLKTRSTPFIGVVVPDIRNPFFPAVMDGVSHFLMEKGYEAFVSSSDESVSKQRSILGSFRRYPLAGVIVIPTGSMRKIDLDFRDLIHRIPTVLIDRDIPSLRCAKVLLDNKAGAEELTRYLISCGHRRIGFISPPSGLSIGKERLDGYRKALLDHGISFRRELVYRGTIVYG